MPKPDYQSPAWADVVPIPQDEGGPNPLAAIAYTEEYSEASDYLRALMAADEQSERALQLTEHIIGMNPAHYTVWVYRASILKSLNIPPAKELAFLTSISLKHLKNYQIWHHRQVVVSQMPALPPTEPEFLAMVLARDVKNYHVWSYRQWLVRHFELWADQDGDSEEITSQAEQQQQPGGGKGELAYVEKLLSQDVRNNSAWHHRHFVIFGRPTGPSTGPITGNEEPRAKISSAIIDRELAFARDKIAIAPQNQSAWNYLQGVLARSRKQESSGGSEMIDELRRFALEYADVDRPETIRSTFALDFLIGLWTEDDTVWGGEGSGEGSDNGGSEGGKGKERVEAAATERQRNRQMAATALDLLADTYDPIRRKYWMWRKRKLLASEAGATATTTAGAEAVPVA